MHNKGEFLHRLQSNTGLATREDAERVTSSVLTTLRIRLTPKEADDVEAQLPMDLKPVWRGPVLQALAKQVIGGGQQTLTFQEFVERVARDTGLDRDKALEMTRAVFHLLKEQITAGEAKDVAAQLPKALKVIWLES